MDGSAQQSLQASAGLHRVNLHAVPKRERFDYWRELFAGTFIDRDRADRESDFLGEMLSGNGPDGARFANLRSDPLICTFGKRDCGLVLIGFVEEGTVRLRNERDDIAVADAESGLMLFDCDRPVTSVQSRYELSRLAA